MLLRRSYMEFLQLYFSSKMNVSITTNCDVLRQKIQAFLKTIFYYLFLDDTCGFGGKIFIMLEVGQESEECCVAGLSWAVEVSGFPLLACSPQSGAG